jgi:hypothetical protein
MEKTWKNLMQRRTLLQTAGLGAAAATILATKATSAKAATMSLSTTDIDILTFALNLEYLEATYYRYAFYGAGLPPNFTTGSDGTPAGTVIGGSQVPFTNHELKAFARELVEAESSHVYLIRETLRMAGAPVIAAPQIDLTNSFNAAAAAAGLGSTFDPFADENSFLLGSFIFEDVGVSAYAGSAANIVSSEILTTAARILALEAYHAGSIRTRLILGGYATQTNDIAAARLQLTNQIDTPQNPGGGTGDLGVLTDNRDTIADTVPDVGLPYTRTPQQVLNVVYLGQGTSSGGFFPQGVNGAITTT